MSKRTVPISILIFIWLAIIGGVFWWWQGRGEKKEAGVPSTILEKSGPAAIVETPALEETGLPAQAVKTFFDYLSQEKYAEAEKLLAPDYLDFVNSMGGFERTWGSTPASERPTKIVITDEKVEGDTAEVWFLGYKPSGELIEGEGMMFLTKIKGTWKLSKPH